MESEVALLSPSATEFNFDSGCSIPYISAPSSPARIPCFVNSDSQVVDKFCGQFRQLPSCKDAKLENQGIERTQRSSDSAEEDEFSFDFGGNGVGHESVFAEELFDGGKIRLLKTELKVKPPVKTEIEFENSNTNPKISQEQRSSSSPLSSRFTHSSGNGEPAPRKTTSRSMSLVHKTVSFWDMFPFSKSCRKWKLKDLLFRSASEGRHDVVVRSSNLWSSESNGSKAGSNRRRMKTMEVIEVVDSQIDAVRASSFRSNESSGSNRRRTRARSVSAHELHYTMNRAASEESKRKTFLPYKQGLLGCLGFGNPTAVNDVVGRVGSMTRG